MESTRVTTAKDFSAESFRNFMSLLLCNANGSEFKRYLSCRAIRLSLCLLQ